MKKKMNTKSMPIQTRPPEPELKHLLILEGASEEEMRAISEAWENSPRGIVIINRKPIIWRFNPDRTVERLE